MLRRAAVLGFVALAAGCTQEIVLEDMPDALYRDAGATKDTAPSGGDDAWCARWEPLDYEPRVAQLVIVLDRSLAMQTAFGGTTRAEAAESALMDAINKYQAKVKFGFEQFPADSNDKDYGECQRNSCCAGSVIPTNWNNGPKISGSLQCGDFGSPCPYPSSETASHVALQKVRDFYYKERVPLEEDNDHYVLLVTASEPYCFSSSDACEQALDAADELGEIGIRVLVLSVGYQPTSSSCLARLSKTGSKLAVPSGLKTLYTLSSVSNLNAAVAEIALALAKTTCTMESSDTPPPDDATVKISVGRTSIPQVDGTAQSGWSFANAERTRIVLSGASCELFVYSWDSVSAGYSCSTCGGSPACPNSSSR